MQKSLSKNAFYKAVLNVFNLIVPLLVNPYIMNVLDVELYGAYNRVYAEFTVFLTLGAFGIYNYGVREISQVRSHPDKVNRLFTSLFVIGVLANVVVGIIYVIYFSMVSSGIDFYIYAIMMIQLVGNMFYIEFINEAAENYRFITVKTILIRIGYLVSIFLFVRKPTDILPYTAVVCLTVFLNNFVSFVYLKRSLHFVWKHVSIVRHLVPLIIALILANVEILYGQLDKLMIGRYLGDVEVSYYVIPTTLIGMISTVPLSLVSVAIPRLSTMIGEGDRDGYVSVLNQTRDVFFAMLTPMCLGVVILALEIMQIYGGDNYAGCWPVLVIAALIRLFGFGNQSIVMNLMMYINGLEKKMVWLLGLFGFVNLGMNVVLIWTGLFTTETALFTTGIATILFSVVAFRYTVKVLHLPIKMISSSQVKYLLVSVLFIPVGIVMKMLPGGAIVHAVLTMIPCILLYGLALYYWQDDLLVLILKKCKLERFLPKQTKK